jgi:hypothetical protein
VVESIIRDPIKQRAQCKYQKFGTSLKNILNCNLTINFCFGQNNQFIYFKFLQILLPIVESVESRVAPKNFRSDLVFFVKTARE